MLRKAVNWALARIAPAPDVATRANEAFAKCLANLEASVWPDAIACFSGLNADGCPIEFAFSSRDCAVRFTAEAAAPEVPAPERLAHAVKLLDALGPVQLPESVHTHLTKLQGCGTLNWGAAVAGRHSSDSDRFKLYAEVPEVPMASIDVDLRAARLRHMPRMVMLGWESGSDFVERYFRSEALTLDELDRVLDVCDLRDRARELKHAVSLSWKGSADAALGAVWGLSLAGPRGGACASISLFKEANRVLGGDARTRIGLLRLAAELEAGDFNAYSRVTAPFVGKPGTGAHGMLALTVTRGRPLELRVGLSPTAAWQAL